MPARTKTPMKTATLQPQRKVYVGTVVWAAWSFVLLVIRTYDLFDVPPDVAVAGGALLQLICSYAVPPAAEDIAIPR